MTVFVLALLTTLQIQSYDLGDEYYLLLDTGGTTASFSSFRLSEPERIVLEVAGRAADTALPSVGATVGRIERNDLGDKTRFVFFISPGSAYTILHRKNLLLVAFRQELFITDETIETTLAAIETRLADKKAALAAAEAEKLAAEAEKLAAEQAKLAAEEAKRLAEAAAAEEKRLAALQKPAPEQKVAVVVPEQKTVVAPVRPAPEDEDALVGVLAAEQSRKQAQEESARRAALEKERLEKEAAARAAEQARLAKAEEERKLAEAKHIEDQRRAEAEQKRLAEAKAAEEKKLAEAKVAEEKRIAEAKVAEEKRLAALQKAEEEKRIAEQKAAEEKRLAEAKTAEAKMKELKVVKLEPTRQITDDAPPLKVVTLAAKGKLRNLFFRKFPEFSRVTMEVTGELDYAFREIKGGYVIDIHNFEKIPSYLLHIIDTRAFNAEVQYIYPKKEGKVFKIYIKSDQNIAVRKSDEAGLIHFDFYVPTMQ